MKNNIKRIAIVTLVLAGALTLSACKKTTQESGTIQNEQGAASQTQESSPQPQANAVEIANFAFSPATITVKAGETITITNKDTAGHTFTSDDGSSFDTGIITKDQTVTVTAPSEPGTYPFHCTPHPNMKGTLIVQ
jgi:plastocyanin